ncbi:MAG: PTS transporter subunit EIIB [Cellulosilyticaceae bacterium]
MNYLERIKEVEKLGSKYLEKLGGEKNILEIEACSTRMRVILLKKEKIDREAIEKLGAKGIIDREANEVHIIIGVDSEEIVEAIQKKIGVLG